MATSYLAPGVYVEELATGAHAIEAVGTSIPGFVGVAPQSDAQPNVLVACSSWSAFLATFAPPGSSSNALSHAVFGFFNNGGSYCYVVNVGKDGSLQTGLSVLEQTDVISIVVAPGFDDADAFDQLLSHAENRKDRFAILETPANVPSVDSLTKVPAVNGDAAPMGPGGRGGAAPTPPANKRPRVSKGGYGAVYYPKILVADPLAQVASGAPRPRVYVSPSGHMAGIYARSDSARGVFKAPANEPIRGALGIEKLLTRGDQEQLNPAGINAIRFFATDGVLAYGARTLDESSSDWRYVNVRRLFIMLEQSVVRGTQWVVFEPNDQSLWKAIVRDVSAFLRTIWASGALMGRTPAEAFFVKCDAENNPTESINAGRVVITIGVAPVKPAEFVIFRIGQQASGAIIES